MKLKLDIRRFLSLNPSSSANLHHLVGTPSPSLLPLGLQSPSLPIILTNKVTPSLTLPITLITSTPNPLFAPYSQPHEPSSSSSSHHLSSSSSPDPSPDPTTPESLSDAHWQSQFSVSLAYLHTSLPLFFPPNPPPTFPPDIYHPNIHLSLPIPLGGLEEMRGLTVYGLVFGGARRSLSLLLSGVWVRVERCTILPPGGGASGGEAGAEEQEAGRGGRVEGVAGGGGDGEPEMARKEGNGGGSINKARMDRKVRLRIKVGGRLRLPLPVEGGLLGGGEGVEREWAICEFDNVLSFRLLFPC